MIIAISVLPGSVFAQTPSDRAGARIDQRQANQQQRIDAGFKSGELNAKEARRIEHVQDTQSARIARQKHDKQKAIK